MASPFPQLQIYPSSGLSFPWAEYQESSGRATGDYHLGPDGVGAGLVMLIRWEDLEFAITEILGFSYRNVFILDPYRNPTISRYLPWQHPMWNQLYAKAITRAQGLQMSGQIIFDTGPFLTTGTAIVNEGPEPNLGPYTSFTFVALTIQFWRPPYYLRTDQDVIDADGFPQEWLRYTDRNWVLETELLTRQAGGFVFSSGPAFGTKFPTPTGQKVSHQKIKRTWYQIPAQSVFAPWADSNQPDGLPKNLIYTQTGTTNPITGQPYKGNFANPGTNNPIQGCVNSPIGGGIVDSADLQFLGCPMGTLLLESIEITPRPLQLPAAIMSIPPLIGSDGVESIAQEQYDITFHFDLFDPPVGIGVTFNGHNLVPFAGDGLWYPATTQLNAPAFPRTLFDYADFSDLFLSL